MNTANTNHSINSILGYLRQLPLTPDDKRLLASKLNEEAALEDGEMTSPDDNAKPVYRMREVEEMSPMVQRLAGIIPAEQNPDIANETEDMNGDRYRTEYLKEKYGL
ncbi:MAG: hypothetical protein I3J02_03420 [Prevotella sp.]|nr:hypothetical protein [Prevotella sp.]